MELKAYGRGGKPVLVFPSGGGRFHDFEDFGMVEACRALLDEGRVQLFAVDGVDHQSWLNESLPPALRARRHEDYERYIVSEALPFIRDRNGSGARPLTTGCSGGAYHAANFLFRRPDLFDAVVALSGLYAPDFIFHGRWDDALYYHFPLCYLPGRQDERLLGLIRRSRIVLCVGQGAWETCHHYDCVGETRRLKEVLEAKGIPCWADFWGRDVEHDWPWWRRQLPYFLGHVT
jgi:esterase/lipase superfamily enzyme